MHIRIIKSALLYLCIIFGHTSYAQHNNSEEALAAEQAATSKTKSVSVALPADLKLVYLRSSKAYEDNLICELRNAAPATLLDGECGGSGWCEVSTPKATGTCKAGSKGFLLCKHVKCENIASVKIEIEKKTETPAKQNYPKLEKLFSLEDPVIHLDYDNMSYGESVNYSVPGARLPKQRDDPRSQGYCYRGVKIALRQAELVDSYLEGASAIQAGPKLLENGFKKLDIKDPSKAPAGAVIVYGNTAEGKKSKEAGGGGKKHGHIEIKTNKNTYFSDYKTTIPITEGANSAWYTVEGIYYKAE